MTAEQYLKSGPVDIKYVANKMWPSNKNANVYMSMKLNGKRSWTKDDEEKAVKILAELGSELTSLFK